jgi:hypothetical protein
MQESQSESGGRRKKEKGKRGRKERKWRRQVGGGGGSRGEKRRRKFEKGRKLRDYSVLLYIEEEHESAWGRDSCEILLSRIHFTV